MLNHAYRLLAIAPLVSGLASGLVLVVSAPTLAAAATPVDHIKFRDILWGGLSQRTVINEAGKRLTRDFTLSEKQATVFLPVPDLLKDISSKDPHSFFFTKEASLQAAKPVSLYQLGVSTPAHPWTRSQVEGVLASIASDGDANVDPRLKPVTLVVLPGVSSELITNMPMGDVLRVKGSSFEKFCDERIAAMRARDGQAADATLKDSIYSLRFLEEREADLTDVAKCASIDDENGKPLVNVVVLPAPFMSLESFGRQDEVAQILTRRVEKLFHALEEPGKTGSGIPKNLGFIGYSRGTPLGLEMLSQAQADPAAHPWLKNTRAMVTLGGVIYGSDVADLAVNYKKAKPVPFENDAYTALKALKTSLKYPENGKALTQKQKNWNSFNWGLFLGLRLPRLAHDHKDQFEIKKPAAPEMVTGEADPEFQEVSDKAKSGDFRSGLQLMADIFLHTLDLERPVGDYDHNMLKFKAMTEKVFAALEDLSTPKRFAWWASHTIPTEGIRYYSITGTMLNRADVPEHPGLADNNIGFDEKLDDNKNLSQQHDHFSEILASKDGKWMRFNDSQVAAYKARFWPSLTQKLNPNQKPFDSTYLGMMATHHWGLALQGVAKQVDDKTGETLENQFPRRDMVKALAAAIATDLKSGVIKAK